MNSTSSGHSGSVLSFIFTQKGVFTIDNEQLEGKDADELELEFIDGGAEEVEKDDELTIITTSFEDYGNMQNKLAELGIEVKSTELQRIPNTTTALDVESAKKVLNVIDKFEEDDDVQAVYHNLEMTEELMNELENG